MRSITYTFLAVVTLALPTASSPASAPHIGDPSLQVDNLAARQSSPNDGLICPDGSTCDRLGYCNDYSLCPYGLTCGDSVGCNLEYECDLGGSTCGIVPPTEPATSSPGPNDAVCANKNPKTGAAFTWPTRKYKSMQEYCMSLGPVCVAQVLTFVAGNVTTASGNPGNCGNACSCETSKCPAVPPSCGDPRCELNPVLPGPGNFGSCIGSVAAMAKGDDWRGCPCNQ